MCLIACLRNFYIRSYRWYCWSWRGCRSWNRLHLYLAFFSITKSYVHYWLSNPIVNLASKFDLYCTLWGKLYWIVKVKNEFFSLLVCVTTTFCPSNVPLKSLAGAPFSNICNEPSIKLNPFCIGSWKSISIFDEYFNVPGNSIE